MATREGWLCLAAVMDLHTRTIKSYALSERMQVSLVEQALDCAIERWPGLSGAVIHSDRGCQYTSHRYRRKLEHHGLIASMGATGNCYDNAAMESFWSTLKTECFPEDGVFRTRSMARQEIFEYIDA